MDSNAAPRARRSKVLTTPAGNLLPKEETVKYLANCMEVKITKVDERKWEATGHSPCDNGRHFDIGTLELVPYDSGKPDDELLVTFESVVAEASNYDGTETWLAARPFTAKELRELADLMDATGKAAAAEGLNIVAEQGIATAAGN